jgi:hypothetical protein
MSKEDSGQDGRIEHFIGDLEAFHLNWAEGLFDTHRLNELARSYRTSWARLRAEMPHAPQEKVERVLFLLGSLPR